MVKVGFDNIRVDSTKRISVFKTVNRWFQSQDDAWPSTKKSQTKATCYCSNGISICAKHWSVVGRWLITKMSGHHQMIMPDQYVTFEHFQPVRLYERAVAMQERRYPPLKREKEMSYLTARTSLTREDSVRTSTWKRCMIYTTITCNVCHSKF